MQVPAWGSGLAVRLPVAVAGALQSRIVNPVAAAA